MAASAGNLTARVLVQIGDSEPQQVAEVPVPVSVTISRDGLSGSVRGTVALDDAKIWGDVATALHAAADRIAKL